VPDWLLVVTAILVGALIWRIGIASLRVFSPDPGEVPAPPEAEDVEALEVYFVCGECGTELKVSRLGEMQVPRHCGEKMQVERRPAGI
jgi:hypothetical protein